MTLKKDLFNVIQDFPYLENGKVSDVIVKSQKEEIYTVIVAENGAKVSKKKVGALTMLARGIGAKPIIVSERLGDERLLEDVVYERHKMAVVNLETFEKILEGDNIYIKKKKSVFAVSLNNKKLKELCEENGISLGELANILGVSRKSVYDYLRGRKDVSVDVAIKLAELFGDDVLKPVELGEFEGIKMEVEPHTPLEEKVLEKVSSPVHVPKGNVSLGGKVDDVEFTALVPHGDEELEWFGELSNLIDRLSVAIGFEDVPKNLEESRAEVVKNLQQFFQLFSRA